MTGKFSIRLVPDMEPADVERLVKTHLEKLHADSGSPNPMKYVEIKFLKVNFYSLVIEHLYLLVNCNPDSSFYIIYCSYHKASERIIEFIFIPN